MSNPELTKRELIERKVVRKLITSMSQHGWAVDSVDDGEMVFHNPSDADVMKAIFSVDESWIRFKKGSMSRSAFIVLGNSGLDCICDYDTSNPGCTDDDFEEIMRKEIDPYCQSLEDKA